MITTIQSNVRDHTKLVVLPILLAGLLLVGQSVPAYAAPTTVRLVGTMTMTVQVPNVYLTSSEVYQFTTNVEVLVDHPMQIGPYTEQNSFSLVIQSTPVVNAYGEASLFSSMPFDGVLFQYWTYNAWQESNGNISFRGELFNNHAAEGVALNLITIPSEIAPNLVMPFTYAMTNGTQMVGTFELNNGSVAIVVEGNTTDGYRPFRLEIIATSGSSTTNSRQFS